MKKDLTKGNITKTLLLFAAPMILGNLLQQCYNIADTFIVGKFLGSNALAAVGSAYSLMTFLTSVLIGLCMGSSAVLSTAFGANDKQRMRQGMTISFIFITAVTVLMNIAIVLCINPILKILHTPPEIYKLMHDYTIIIFSGIYFVFLYNYFAFLLRAIGNSVVPLYFLAVATVLNIMLDIIFVPVLKMGVGGAALATVVAQAVSGLGIGFYTWIKEPWLRLRKTDFTIKKKSAAEVIRHSVGACIQQSVMNFGILMIQGLVNSFGTTVMAAFSAAVKIDSFAYMPAQEFGNAFSLFISQNYGSGKYDRVHQGMKKALKTSVIFCLILSAAIFILAPELMQIFVDGLEIDIIRTGSTYLRIEGSFYFGIGILFLLYGFYRGIGKPEMSLILTIISLGTRVALAYILAPISSIGVNGIWWAIPIGWILADTVGILFIKKTKCIKIDE